MKLAVCRMTGTIVSLSQVGNFTMSDVSRPVNVDRRSSYEYDLFRSDDERSGLRELLFGGQLFVFSPRPSSIALCEFADELIKKPSATCLLRKHSIACPSRNMPQFFPN